MMTPIQQINAIVGLCFRIKGWPEVLRKLGYVPERIELKFDVLDPQGASHTVNPDVLLVSDRLNSSLLFEAKSGGESQNATINQAKIDELKNQLGRYSLISLKDLIQKVGIPSSNPRHHVYTLILLCNEEHKNFYRSALEQNGKAVALVTIGEDNIKLIFNTIQESKTHQVFSVGISIKDQFLPVSLIPFLLDADRTETAKHIVSAVIVQLIRRTRSITADQLLGVIFDRGLWQAFDTDAKRTLKGIVKDIVREMCDTEFREYIALRAPGRSPCEWVLKNHPDNRKTRQFQALKTLKVEYINRLSRGEAYKGYNPQQESLFAALEEIEEDNFYDLANKN